LNAEVLTALIAEISRTIKEFVEASFQAPDDDSGSSYYSALLILTEIGEVGRFPSANTYALTPAWFPVCRAPAVNLTAGSHQSVSQP